MITPGTPHETTYRAFLTTWGIAIFLTASAKLCEPSCGSTEGEPVVPGVRLRVEAAGISATFIRHLRSGLNRVASNIRAATQAHEVVVIVTGLDYSNVDFQETALEAAIMQWAAEYFDFEPITVVVTLDESGRCYLFEYG